MRGTWPRKSRSNARPMLRHRCRNAGGAGAFTRGAPARLHKPIRLRGAQLCRDLHFWRQNSVYRRKVFVEPELSAALTSDRILDRATQYRRVIRLSAQVERSAAWFGPGAWGAKLIAKERYVICQVEAGLESNVAEGAAGFIKEFRKNCVGERSRMRRALRRSTQRAQRGGL